MRMCGFSALRRCGIPASATRRWKRTSTRSIANCSTGCSALPISIDDAIITAGGLYGTIRAMDLRKIKADPEDFGIMTYDPAFMNTANCRSSITYIDGDKGILLCLDRKSGATIKAPVHWF